MNPIFLSVLSFVLNSRIFFFHKVVLVLEELFIFFSNFIQLSLVTAHFPCESPLDIDFLTIEFLHFFLKFFDFLIFFLDFEHNTTGILFLTVILFL